MGALKRFVNTFVFAKEKTAGELHYIAPNGKIEIKAVISSKAEEQDIRRIINIMLDDCDYSDCGLTD